MGCWNGTCGLTNLPIRRGAKVVLFPLIHNKHARVGSGGFCYPSDQYTFISLPLYGKYDDGGSIEKITKNGDVSFAHLMELIKEGREITVNEHEMERQKYFDKDFGTPKDIEDLIANYIERGVYQGVGLMMVLESVFDDVNNAVSKRREAYIEQGKEFIDKYKAWKESEEGKAQYGILWNAYQLWGDDHAGYHDNRFASFWGESGGDCRSTYPFRDMLYGLADMEDYSQTLDAMVDLMVMEDTLFQTRKFWSIQCGAGSQAENYGMLFVLTNSVLKQKNKAMKNLVEDCGWTREEAEQIINRV